MGTGSRQWGWKRRSMPDARGIVLALLALLLIYQVLLPFAMIIWTSFKVVRPGEPGFLTLNFTLANYIRAYGTRDFWDATWNTFCFAVASTAVSFLLGAFLAWVVDRTNTPLARLIGLLTLGRIIIPGILIAVSWILIASPTIGIVNYFLEAMTGMKRLVNIYSFWGMVWVHSLEMTPLAYLLLSAAFQAMDPRLEEASMMAGAGTWSTLRRISFPLILPASAATILLLFIQTVETFEVPLLLGGRANVRLYTTEVFFNTSRTPTDWGMASTYSIALLVLSVALLLGYFRLVRHSERYQTVTGKDYRPRRVNLGAWRYLTCALSLLLVFLITGLPFLIMLYSSFLPRYQPPTPEAFRAMTLANYTGILGEEAYAIGPMWNSTLLGLGAATAVILLASAICYFVHKSHIPGRKLLDFLGFAPIALPSVVLGTAFLWFYLIVPLPVIGTLAIIGLAYITRYLAFALRFISTSMLQIHTDLEEAADVAGVPWWKNFFLIYLPLLRPGLMAAWFWVMVHAYRELTIALMLARSKNRTAAVIIYDLWENGSFQQLSAFGVLMFILLIVLVSISQIIGKRFGVQEQI